MRWEAGAGRVLFWGPRRWCRFDPRRIRSGPETNRRRIRSDLTHLYRAAAKKLAVDNLCTGLAPLLKRRKMRVIVVKL